jgi:hypothetical protein
MPTVVKMDELALTSAAIGRPELREAVPELQNFEIYGHYAEIVRRADPNFSPNKEKITDWQNPSGQVVHAIEDILWKTEVFDIRKD